MKRTPQRGIKFRLHYILHFYAWSERNGITTTRRIGRFAFPGIVKQHVIDAAVQQQMKLFTKNNAGAKTGDVQLRFSLSVGNPN